MSTEDDCITFVSTHSNKKIDVIMNPLPMYKEVISLLIREKAMLNTWIAIAKKYYKAGHSEFYAEILEKSREESNMEYKDSNQDQMILLDGLAAYYVNLAKKEGNRDAKKDFMIKATRLYTAADKIIVFDENHLIGRAFLCMMESDKIDQAETQFNFVLDQSPDNILALLGKARVNFVKNEYKASLSYYRKALELFPDGLVSIRVGMGICFYKMGKIDLAKIAFQRAIDISSNCVNGLAALAILLLNQKSSEGTKQGMQLLSRAYSLDPNNSLVMITLADHFFYKQDYSKVERLATLAMQHTNNDHIRSRSFYQLGRCYHLKNDYENAYNYYYQSTQLASSKFSLPWYGLGQVYLKREDLDNAIKCFEKVLSITPNSIDSIKLLSICYLKSDNYEKIILAKDLYKKLVESFPDDEEAWIGLGEAYQTIDIDQSLESYNKACDIIKNKGMTVAAEIYNNMGSLYFRVEDYKKALHYFECAINIIADINKDTSAPKPPLYATVSYNLGRIYEKLADMEKAENQYRTILKIFPEYIDCYLRLGYIFKTRGDFRNASEWFNMALRVDPDSAEAWLYLAGLHIIKHEYGPAQKKYEKVMLADPNNYDLYSWIAVSNIWLNYLQSSLGDSEKKRKYTDRCLSLYRTALRKDPKNICAANGIGCVLAYNSHFSFARDVFSQCREATATIPDIWINLGNIYMEYKQYANAIKMYQGCYDNFYAKNPNIDVLLYLARAYYRSEQYINSKMIIIKCLYYFSRDSVALFNLSIILEKCSSLILKNDKATVSEVTLAIAQLELAQKNFSYLATPLEQTKIDRNAADSEKRACCDLIIQANYNLLRAKQQEDSEAELMRSHRIKLQEFQKQQAREEEAKLQLKKQKEQELVQKRMEYLKHAQQTLLSLPTVDEEKPKTKKNKSQRIDEEDSNTDDIKIDKRKKRKAKDKSPESNTDTLIDTKKSNIEIKLDEKYQTEEFVKTDSSTSSIFSEEHENE